jgi:hypothetical protein
MRVLRTRNHGPLFPPGPLIDRNAGGPRRLRIGSDCASILTGPEANNLLDSWKEIASHLRRTVRTVQRWEKYEGLPVHRHLHQRSNSVYAYRSEVDKWWNREADSAEIRPLRLSTEGFRKEVTRPQASSVCHSAQGCREAHSAPFEGLLEFLQRLSEVEVYSLNDDPVQVVFVLRSRIQIQEYTRQPVIGRATRDAKAFCRSLSLAGPERPGHSAGIRGKEGKSVLWRN